MSHVARLRGRLAVVIITAGIAHSTSGNVGFGQARALPGDSLHMGRDSGLYDTSRRAAAIKSRPVPNVADILKTRIPDDEAIVYIELRKHIQDEIDSLALHPWAGRYYRGHGFGFNVSIWMAPEAGYLYQRSGCRGIYERQRGAVSVKNGLLHLRGRDEVYQMIRWSERLYLIPTSRIVAFCNSINSGEEPRMGERGFHLLREGDHRISVSGFPMLPPRYAEYLLEEPVTASVINVESYYTQTPFGPMDIAKALKAYQWRVSITLNAGSREGLRQGMELNLVSPAGRYRTCHIEEVSEHTANASIRQFGSKFEKPEIGWRFSTRLQFHQPVLGDTTLVAEE